MLEVGKTQKTIYHILAKAIGTALAMAVVWSPGLGWAQNFDQDYEQRAQEVVAGLTRLNGLAGWESIQPASWPRLTKLDEDYRQSSIRQIPAVGWEGGSTPARLVSLNLVNLGLQRAADFSGLSRLRRLELSGNSFKAINIDGNAALIYLAAQKNQLTAIRLSGSPQLTRLSLPGNQLEKIDISNNRQLSELILSKNRLSKLELSRNGSLTNLEALNNNLDRLDLAANPLLTRLQVSYNRLSTLNVGANPNLVELGVRENNLAELDITSNAALVELNVGRNNLKKLDVSQNPKLTELVADQNLLQNLDVSQNLELKVLEIQDNPLTELVIGANKLETLNVDGCRLPLSRLASLTSLAQNRTRLGFQEKVLFENKTLILGEPLDLSAEATIKGSATVFIILNEKKRRLSPANFTEADGVIYFKKPGLYYVEMSHPQVVSSDQIRPGGTARSYKAKARTGLVEVLAP